MGRTHRSAPTGNGVLFFVFVGANLCVRPMHIN